MIELMIKLVPAIVSLMSFAEKWFSDRPKSGAEKKEFVLGVAQTLVSGVEAVSTGGQADTMAKIKEPLGQIIDSTASLLFSKTGTNY